MKINQLLDKFLVEAETEESREKNGIHMIPTEMGKRLLRDFAVWCDERLTKRVTDSASPIAFCEKCQKFHEENHSDSATTPSR